MTRSGQISFTNAADLFWKPKMLGSRAEGRGRSERTMRASGWSPPAPFFFPRTPVSPRVVITERQDGEVLRLSITTLIYTHTSATRIARVYYEGSVRASPEVDASNEKDDVRSCCSTI